MSVINRAEYFIVDCTSPNAVYELSIILKKKGIDRKNIFIIGNELHVKDLTYFDYYLESNDPVVEIENITEKITLWVQELSLKSPVSISEAERLFKLKEYRPAFISAFSDIESKLRQYYFEYCNEIIMKEKKYNKRIVSLSELFEVARMNNLCELTQNEVSTLINIRNLAVHENRNVSSTEARKIIEINKQITKSLQSSDL